MWNSIGKQIEKIHGKYTSTKKYSIQLLESPKEDKKFENQTPIEMISENDKLVLEHYAENLVHIGN